MASPRSAWGIDLGNRALKAIKLTLVGDDLVVDDFEVIEHEQILSSVGDNRESMLQVALGNFVHRHNLGQTPVAVGVSGQSSFARFIKLPPVEDRKIPEIVRFEAIQQIPFPLDDVEWSYQLFSTPDSPDKEVGIFAMRKELVNKQIEYLTSQGLNVQVVQMIPLAVYNAMHHDRRVQDTVMFMDCGAENTDLVIADGHTVWMRTLQIGGNSFTEALGKAFKLNFAKAEELKRNAATSKYAKQIFQAMRPVFADLVADVQRSIGFYASVHRDARLKKIMVMGSSFQLPGLQKYLQQHVQMEVERLDAFRAASPADGKLATLFAENVISLGGAYGLALQGLERGHITSSLLPAQIRRAKMWKGKTKWFALAAGLMVAATAGEAMRYAYDNWQFNERQGVRQQIGEVLRDADNHSRLWAMDVQDKGKPDRDKIIQLRGMLTYRNLWPTLFKDLSDLMPQKSVTEDVLRQLPRTSRRALYFDSIAQTYRLDMADIIDRNKVPDSAFVQMAAGSSATPSHGAAPQDGVAPVAGSAAKRGFVLTIRGYTPMASGSLLIEQSLVEGLRQLNADLASAAGKPYYVGRWKIVNIGRRQPSAARAAMGGGLMGMPMAAGGPMGMNPAPATPPAEPTDTDTEFTLLVAIVLDPPASAVKSGGQVR